MFLSEANDISYSQSVAIWYLSINCKQFLYTRGRFFSRVAPPPPPNAPGSWGWIKYVDLCLVTVGCFSLLGVNSCTVAQKCESPQRSAITGRQSEGCYPGSAGWKSPLESDLPLCYPCIPTWEQKVLSFPGGTVQDFRDIRGKWFLERRYKPFISGESERRRRLRGVTSKLTFITSVCPGACET